MVRKVWSKAFLHDYYIVKVFYANQKILTKFNFQAYRLDLR
jgi:hypothetical protein